MDNTALNTQKPIEGSQKTFPDGSTRKLDITPSGVHRWLSAGQQESGEQDQSPADSQGTVAPISLEDDKPLEVINRDDWMEYNKYLTVDNPYLYITNYEDGVGIWLQKVYELDSRVSIFKAEENLYQASKQKEIEDIEDLYTKNNNQFLAIQMYKMCALIEEIEKYDHSFDYEAMLEQGASWRDFTDYLSTAKEDE